ncbi:apolipoprotein N-acyltransferase [Acetobacter okinawensis]|uniref:apolipoprotein N-acyltransferase n=1 Tax=Acetobacter okinawensis TaxID=1076594 RepID=UPI001BAAC787|nr:apolipoprotein N-acyltransferase [Acetobacter okinawensis]MBS0988255.1 apolipoprotein N-acyltransferase [Acetobacter okinawensis]
MSAPMPRKIVFSRFCPKRETLCFIATLLGLGGLATLALPPLHGLPILLLSFGLLGYILNTTQNWKRAAWAGALFGFGFYAAGLYWLVYAVLIRADEFWWFVPFPSLGCALILAPTVAAPAALSTLLPAGIRRLSAFAALWTLFDMGRTFIFSGFTWNALGSCLAIPGPIGQLLIQPAAWVGEDGLTLGLVTLSLLCGTTILEQTPLARWISHTLNPGHVPPPPYLSHLRRRVLMCSGAGLLAWGITAGLRLYTVHPAGEPGPITVIVQGNVPETEKIGRQSPRDIFMRYLGLTAQGVQAAQALQTTQRKPGEHFRPIVFLWPETSFPGYELIQNSPRARQAIMEWAVGADAGIIGALRMDDSGHYRNSVVALAPDGAIEAVYDKARLVPFGEYQPPFIPLQIVPQGGMAAGPGPQTWHLADVPAVGPLICYEVIFSGDVVNAHDRPRWLANVTNDAWFGNSAGPRQHLSSVRLRAVEEGLPIARAANTGISVAYDGLGHMLDHLGWGKQGVLSVALPAPLPPTLFGRLGQSIPLALCLMLLGLTCIPYPRRP